MWCCKGVLIGTRVTVAREGGRRGKGGHRGEEDARSPPANREVSGAVGVSSVTVAERTMEGGRGGRRVTAS